ncbi:MAG: RNA polymerase sigma factor [Pseudomonadota bacterium]
MNDKEKALEGYLVAAAKLGDRRAMADLVALRGAGLQAHAGRLLDDPDAAQDVMQDAWIDIFRGLGQLQDVRAFRAWAYRIVSRRCARVINGRQKARAAAKVLTQEADPTIPSEACDEALLVRKALAHLSPEHRATIALFYLQDMGVGEVAVALDIPVGTVKSRLSHARRKLKTLLEGDHND